MCVSHTYTTDYYSAFKRKEILSHATAYMNLEHIMQSEIINKLSQNKIKDQSQKDKYCDSPYTRYLEQSNALTIDVPIIMMMSKAGSVHESV